MIQVDENSPSQPSLGDEDERATLSPPLLSTNEIEVGSGWKMKKQTLRNWLAFTLVFTDTVMIIAGFLLSYALRYSIPFPNPLAPGSQLSSFTG